MKTVSAQKLDIEIGNAGSVSALLIRPTPAHTCFVFAHGAGAGMTHPFMEAVAAGLGERGVATLRYQFPYMEQASKRPDPPGIAQATVRAAVAEAERHCADLRLIAGGKSFGGRMTSQAQATAPLDGVRGLAFLGFPLHPAGKPSSDRAKHLADVHVPMLFLQGTRDSLAELKLLEPLVKTQGERERTAVAATQRQCFNPSESSSENGTLKHAHEGQRTDGLEFPYIRHARPHDRRRSRHGGGGAMPVHPGQARAGGLLSASGHCARRETQARARCGHQGAGVAAADETGRRR